VRYFLCVLFVILICAGCVKKMPVQFQPPMSEHQIKLTFGPDDGMTYITGQEIEKLYGSAVSAGKEMGYRIIRSDQARGQIIFVREGLGDSYLINLEVIVLMTDNRQTAYVHIKTSSLSEVAAQSAAREYRDKYKKMLN